MVIDQKKLQEIYQSRPDLQAVYKPDGTAIDLNNPAIKGIPTLQDWAQTYGIKEVPDLDPTQASLSKYFTPDQIATMPDDIRTALSAFIDVQTKNFEAGKANADINAQNWNDAMKTAAADPEIAAKYGDALKFSTQTTNDLLSNLAGGFTQEQLATKRAQDLQTKQLAEQEDAAGRAYSGFRAQAEEKLKADQGDIIKSSLRTLKQNIQSAVSPYEKTYGSAGLSKLNMPNNLPVGYESPGGITGSEAASKAADIRSTATDMYNATKAPTQ